jgi:hypothetical protein
MAGVGYLLSNIYLRGSSVVSQLPSRATHSQTEVWLEKCEIESQLPSLATHSQTLY